MTFVSSAEGSDIVGYKNGGGQKFRFLPSNFPEMATFRPEFCIFGRKIFDRLIFFNFFSYV